jgi:hypothetical protein
LPVAFSVVSTTETEPHRRNMTETIKRKKSKFYVNLRRELRELTIKDIAKFILAFLGWWAVIRFVFDDLGAACRIRIKDVLSGLHHEYWLEDVAA